jgi:hypothetical protein
MFARSKLKRGWYADCLLDYCEMEPVYFDLFCRNRKRKKLKLKH